MAPVHTANPQEDVGEHMAAVREEGDPLDRRAVLARVQQGLFQDADDPLQIGRFVVSQRLGTGSSGVVYAAYDPKLERHVALKLLRPDVELGEDARTRLLREAQVLARLRHRHVVAVHDVGDLDGRVFIAMELLEGGTLRQWAEASPRTPAEILGVYLQAGEGLAAAHASGLVHRDFKPDNVLLDDEGQARVVDFGLAREQADPGMSMLEAVATGELREAELDARLTQTGVVLGTPAYMAPEQLAGQPADARTDQYAFCVSLYEALHGERPFAGKTLGALTRATEKGVVRPAPPGRRVPLRIRRALIRGLRPDPTQRHRTMASLLALLRRNPGARMRRGGLALALLATVSGVTWTAATATEQAPAAMCSGFEDQLEGRWDDARRTSLENTLSAVSQDGRDTWERVRPRFDAFAEAWVLARRDTCEARELRHDQSEDLLDMRVLCLDRALSTLDAAAAQLALVDTQTIVFADDLIPHLGWIEECDARGVLDEGVRPPTDPELRERLRKLDAGLAQTRSVRLAGKYPEAQALAQTLVEEAKALGHAPTHARALRELGICLSQNQRPLEAIETLAHALVEAERGQADRTRALTTTLLAKRLAELGKHDEARRLAAIVEALYERLAHPPYGTPIRVELLWAHLESAEGNYDDAIERLDHAIALATESGPDDSDMTHAVLLSKAISDRGITTHEAGRATEALPFLQRALELRQELVGPDHPEIAGLHFNLGGVRFSRHENALAEIHFRRALEIRERALGPEHGALANTLTSLGAVAMRTKRVPEGLAYMRRGFDIMKKSLGADHPRLAIPLHNMALAHIRLEHFDEAKALVEQALELRRRTLGPTHKRTLDSIYQLGYVQQKAGDLDEAEATYGRHLALAIEHQPQDLVSQVYTLIVLADLALLRESPADAQTLMERAEPLLSDAPEHDALRAAVAFNLAQALDARGRDPARAQELAQRALALTTNDSQRTVIEEWLVDH